MFKILSVIPGLLTLVLFLLKLIGMITFLYRFITKTTVKYSLIAIAFSSVLVLFFGIMNTFDK